jgi:hypothetical protein
MRRLLLLLLTLLLPLQLLAATAGDVPSRAAQGESAGAGWHEFQHELPHDRQAASSVVAAGQDGDDADADAPAIQAECEDHTMPSRIATPHIPWQSFPHAFSTPLSWPSFVRDQLRPPPLA